MNLKTDTPLKRIGLIFLVFYGVFIISYMTYWNFIVEPLFSYTNETVYSIAEKRIIIPAKPPSEKGMGWMRSKEDNAWHKTSEECDDDNWKKSRFDLTTAKVIDNLTLEEKRTLAKQLLTIEEEKEKFCPVFSALADVENYRWETTLDEFFREIIKIWQATLLLFLGVLLFIGGGDLFIKAINELCVIIKKTWEWIKTGKWEKKTMRPEKTQKKFPMFSARSKKWIYGTVVFFLGALTQTFLNNSEIKLGALPYTAIMMFWVWLFFKVTGMSLGNMSQKLQQEDEKTALMKNYKITKNKDELYSYAGKNYQSYEEALDAARLDKFKEE